MEQKMEMNHRKKICGIISEMLDRPEENGIYKTTEAYEKLEIYINWVYIEGVKKGLEQASSSIDNLKKNMNEYLL